MAVSSATTRMTDGPIWKRILLFAIPIFWGNLFQQLYNTVDSLIVGNYLGSEALAAVSSSGNLIYLMVGFFNGVSMGAGVIIARYFGAKDMENVQKSIHTTVLTGLFCGIFLSLLGTVLAPFMLRLMGTPADVLPDSLTYFRIYFAGSVGFVMYNCFVGILQALGDSKHPLIYLVIASLVNVVLDYVFIAILGYGVGAAALATIISQFLSAFLCLMQLLHNPPELRLYPKKLHIDKTLFLQIIRNGVPSGVQNSIISLANVFVQANINAFGSLAIAGCGVYLKIQGFAFLPVNCFTMALATFISQNLGAKEYDRAKKGARFALICCCVAAEAIGAVTYVFAPQLIAAFSDIPEVIAYGVAYSRCNGLFFFLCAFTHCMASIFRGSGRASLPMYIMLIFWCLVRVSYIYIAVHFIPKIEVVFWAYPLTWALSSIVFLYFYLKSDWVHGLDESYI